MMFAIFSRFIFKRVFKRTAVAIILILSLFVISCNNPETRTPEIFHKIHESQKVQMAVGENLIGDSEHGYDQTKDFLKNLGLPERITDEMSESQLSFFAEANEVAVLSSIESDDELKMWQTIAMTTNGKIRLYADVEWSSLPNERYIDFIELAVYFHVSDSYENTLLYVSYNGEKIVLEEGTDYRIHILTEGCVGAIYDLGRILKNVTPIPGQSLRIHFEVDIFKVAPSEYDVFNSQLIYEHMLTKYNGVTQIVKNGENLGFLLDEKSGIQLIRYCMSSSYPLDYFPEGFDKNLTNYTLQNR